MDHLSIRERFLLCDTYDTNIAQSPDPGSPRFGLTRAKDLPTVRRFPKETRRGYAGANINAFRLSLCLSGFKDNSEIK